MNIELDYNKQANDRYDLITLKFYNTDFSAYVYIRMGKIYLSNSKSRVGKYIEDLTRLISGEITSITFDGDASFSLCDPFEVTMSGENHVTFTTKSSASLTGKKWEFTTNTDIITKLCDKFNEVQW